MNVRWRLLRLLGLKAAAGNSSATYKLTVSLHRTWNGKSGQEPDHQHVVGFKYGLGNLSLLRGLTQLKFLPLKTKWHLLNSIFNFHYLSDFL